MASFHQTMPNHQSIISIQRPYQSQPIHGHVSSSSFRHTQDEQHKENKKKCRGDRQSQRYRAKLRKRGLTNEEIITSMNNYKATKENEHEHHSTISDVDVELLIPTHAQKTIVNNENTEQNITTKRKRTAPPTGITTSLSQMSISNLPKKRQRSTTMDHIAEDEHTDKSTSNLKPKYLKVSDQIFKELLSKSATDVETISSLIDTAEKLQFLRTYAHLLNNIFYLKLEQDFWEHYNRVCINEAIWSTPLSKDVAKENNLCRFKFKTKPQLDRHYKLLLSRLREVENNLNKHKQQSINMFMDMNKVSMLITSFVRRGQHKLSAEYERKKSILQYDANDHRLVQTFYNLKPTEHQIRSAKIIWQSTKSKLQAEEEIAILKQRIYSKRLPTSLNALDHSIDNMENMLKQPVLNQDKRATLSFRRLKTIAQFKYDILIQTIAVAEETVRGYASLIAGEKKTLIDTAGGQVPIPKVLVQVMNAIATRQSNLVQRSQHILKQKLSVFDDAPMAIDVTGAIGAI